jgi:hypothetical protein
MSPILLLLACYGATFFLQQKAGWLTTPVRTRLALADQLLSCTFCTGFWVGVIAFWLDSVSRGFVFRVSFGEHSVAWLTFAFASAAVCYGLDALIQWLETR